VERSSWGDRTVLIGLRAAIQPALDLLLPVCCAVCEHLLEANEKGIVCGHCWSRVRELAHPRCGRCGHPVTSHACRWCENLPPFVRSARSYCWIGPGTGKAIVHALKYDGWSRVAAEMAQRMSHVFFPADVTEERRAIVPVPLSRERRRERGFNQSALLAHHLAERWKIPAREDLLVRLSSSRSQTRLTPGERLGNVAGAFSVPDEKRWSIRGAHVMLLDDVVTTGATLRASASALLAAGARTISYITFGRAPASGDRLSP
jgi:ComF family protein